LRTQHSYYGIESALDFAILYGRSDLHERLQQEEFPSNMGTRVVWHGGPALDRAAMAHGLALGCLTPGLQAFDLSRGLKPRPSIREIFPWGELAFELLMVAALGGIMGAHSISLDDTYLDVRRQSARHACLKSGNQKKLETEKKDLRARVEAVDKFLSTRVLWSKYAQDLSTRLPSGAVVESFDGVCELESAGKRGGGGGRRTFILRISSPCNPDGSIPREIDAFFKSVRKHPLWLHDFQSVDITDIKRMPARSGRSPAIGFTIICTPRAGMRAVAPAPSGAGGAEGKKEHS
jgi:hypothetical protein